MKFFKLKPLSEKPFLAILLFANDIEELNKKGFSDDPNSIKEGTAYDPLIVNENNLPQFKDGVCLKSISGNQIIDTPLNLIPKPNDDYKNHLISMKEKSIDSATSTEITKGFVFDNKIFSLSTNAQINWHGLMLLNLAGSYVDTEISTIDSEPYLLTTKNIIPFFTKSNQRLAELLKIGREQKRLLKVV